MLSYHPAFDPYHAVYRMLCILHAEPTRVFEREKLQILDFYFLFPQLIADVRLPPSMTKQRKNFAEFSNEYDFSGVPKLIFFRMRPLQDTALRLMASKRLILVDDVQHDIIKFNDEEIPSALASRIRDIDQFSMTALKFVSGVLGAFPLTGKDGLKARTGLVEYRYDA